MPPAKETKAPAKQTVEKKSPEKESLEKDSPGKDTPEKDSPGKETRAKAIDAQPTGKTSAEQKTATAVPLATTSAPAKDREQKASQTKTPDGKTSGGKTPDSKTLDDKTPENTAPPRMASQRRFSGLMPVLWGGVVIVVLGGAALASLELWWPTSSPVPIAPPPPTPVVAAAPAPAALDANHQKMQQEMQGEIDALVDRVAQLEAALAETQALAKAIEPLDVTVSNSPAMAELRQRLAKLEQGLVDVDRAEEVAGLSARLSELESQEVQKMAGDNAQLAALGERITAIEMGRQNPESLQAAVLAIGQLREALRFYRPFTAELETVKAVLEDGEADAAVATLTPLAATGVATVETLRSRFASVASEIVRAAVVPTSGGLVDQTLHRLSQMVSVRRSDDNLRGDSTEAMVARAEAALAAGDLTAALDALRALDGPPAQVAAPWLAEAHSRQQAETAVAQLHTVAIAKATGLMAGSAVRPPAQE